MHVFQKPFAGWGIDIRLPGHAKTDFADCRNKNDFCGRVQTENCPKSKCVTACPTRVERGEKRWWIFRPAFCFCYSLKRFVFGLVWNVSYGTPTCLALDSRALCERIWRSVSVVPVIPDLYIHCQGNGQLHRVFHLFPHQCADFLCLIASTFDQQFIVHL